MSNQSGRHAAINTIIGRTDLGYESAHHAMFDADGIASGPFNSRLLAWLNTKLEATHTSLAGAQHAFAVSLGFADWNSLNTWEALVTYDADAAAYIDATGELFPDDLNTLVLGIKAAGLWDDHIGMFKKAVGVSTLAASMIDLRNTAFNGTAVNSPTHSATAGWSLVAASSQHVNTKWNTTVANSKAAQLDAHCGLRLRGGAPGYWTGVTVEGGGSPTYMGFIYLQNGGQGYGCNSVAVSNGTVAVANGTHFIACKDATNLQLYGNGALNQDAAAVSNGPAGGTGARWRLGCQTSDGDAFGSYVTMRFSCVHGGAHLDAAQAAALTTLIDAYMTAAGET